MHCFRKVTDDLFWVGSNDRRLARFENIHPIPEGVSYNSYLLLDEKTALFDTVDWNVAHQMMENIDGALNGRTLDYIVVTHVEPDHASSLSLVTDKFPEAKIVCTAKAKNLLAQFHYGDDNIQVVKEGDTLSLGKHELTFYLAPMVHWPEVMVAFDKTNGVLFSADAFGAFGALNGKLFADEVEYKNNYEEYARRYYTNIVGKYGPQVQKLLSKAAGLDIKFICPLHGLVFRTPEDLKNILDKYNSWSTYTPEEKGVLIVYASMYGNTENAAEMFATKLSEKGMNNYEMFDVSETHVSTLISAAFKYSHIAFFSCTYNMRIYPPMACFIEDMAGLNLQKRVVTVTENGSWAPQAGALISAEMNKMKEMVVLNEKITVTSSVSGENTEELDTLVDAVLDSMKDGVCICMPN